MAECEEERSIWDIIVDIILGVLDFFVQVLLLAASLKFLIGILGALLAALVGAMIAEWIAALLYMALFLWKLGELAWGTMMRFREIIERLRKSAT